MAYETLQIDVNDGVAVLTFNRPDKKNAVTPEMVVGLARAWTRLRDDPELRVAILTGVGDVFCAGADLGRLIPLLSKARPPEDEFDRAMVAERSIFQTAFLRRFEIWKPISELASLTAGRSKFRPFDPVRSATVVAAMLRPMRSSRRSMARRVAM